MPTNVTPQPYDGINGRLLAGVPYRPREVLQVDVRGKLILDEDTLSLLRQAKDRIDRQYAERIDMSVLAADVGFYRTHFIRLFGAVYGETPGVYRAQRRIERACELLRAVNLNITEICLLVGFNSLGTFSTKFSQIVGLSPSAYRREAERRGGPAPIPGCFALRWRTGLSAAGSVQVTAVRERTNEEAPSSRVSYNDGEKTL